MSCKNCCCDNCRPPINTIEIPRGHLSWPYAGPTEFFRRFMAGHPLTIEDWLKDGSDWGIYRMSPWHMELYGSMTE